MTTKQVLLLILDGWGYREDPKYNAIAAANPAFFNSLWSTYPHTLFQASGEAVGLPAGTIGTSEIGHSIIGAGSIIDTDLVRINKAIQNNTLKDNEALQQLFDHVKKNNSTLHLIGLVSPGGVHSHQDHLYALLKLAKKENIPQVIIHVITDGRDTPPRSGEEYVKQLESFLEQQGIGLIGSISGRYFAMDRDNNWDRIEKEVQVLFSANPPHVSDKKASDVVAESYTKDVGDEFIESTQLKNSSGTSPIISQNDGVFYFNFRPDRARELSMKIAEKAASLNLCFVTMTQYDKTIPSLVAFPPFIQKTCLAEEIAKAGLSQSHIAETEKYAHVTYFLNGGNEKPHQNEQFFLIPSRKDVPTFDLAPHMMAKEIADKAIEEIDKGINFVVINFANADMVGHTGKWDPAVEAIKFEDEQIKRVVTEVMSKGGVAFITADHGNAEIMFDEKTNQPNTAHTLDPIPAIVTVPNMKLKEGTLADVAPTILALFGLQKPEEMTGSNILE